MTIYEAGSVTEAVAYAEELRCEGRYDWFRGQRQNWPLKTTFARLAKSEQRVVEEKFSRFVGWLSVTPGLEWLSDNVDGAFAVAQHYGMPTQYLDFTTDPRVAGFFASGEGSGKACILCLNTSDLRKFWQAMPKRYPPPEFIGIDVSNLWRLQAQRGVFLFCPYPELEEKIYAPDRIAFPAGGQVESPTAEEIYPRKSALEILLDQYFMNESLMEGNARMKEIFTDETFTWISVGQTDWDPDVVLPSGIPQVESWSGAALALWLMPPDEHFDQTRHGEMFVIDVATTDPVTAAKETHEKILDALNRDPDLRRRLVAFTLRRPDGTLIEHAAEVERLWDGIRMLPYTAEEVATSIGNLIALMIEAEQSHLNYRSGDVARSFGPAIEIEIAADDGSYSRAFVPNDAVLAAVRPDLSNYLVPRWREELLGNAFGIIQCIPKPDVLFDFDAFRSLFVRYAVPSQVLARAQGRRPENDRVARAIYYSPARVRRFTVT